MAKYDQRGQNVNNQINIGRDLNISDPTVRNIRRVEVSKEISRIEIELIKHEQEIKETNEKFIASLPNSLRNEVTTEGLEIVGKMPMLGHVYHLTVLLPKVLFQAAFNPGLRKAFTTYTSNHEAQLSQLDSLHKHLGVLREEFELLSQKDP